jgi:hypothetical protein
MERTKFTRLINWATSKDTIECGEKAGQEVEEVICNTGNLQRRCIIYKEAEKQKEAGRMAQVIERLPSK